jgi:hypothetical protein
MWEIHLSVGGNDLKNTPIKDLKDILTRLVTFIKEQWPLVTIIWSEILPRDWGEETKGLLAPRKRFNTYAVKVIKKQWGLLFAPLQST